MPEHYLSDRLQTPDVSPPAPRLMPWLHVSTFEQRGVLVIVVSGELDAATAPDLDEPLREADPTRAVVIDLTECTFIDSSGLQILVRHSRRPRGLALCCTAGDAASRLLHLTGVVDPDTGQGAGLRVLPSREVALEALSQNRDGDGSAVAAAPPPLSERGA